MSDESGLTELDKLRKENEDLREIISGKDKFFSLVMHDTRGILSNVLGFSQLLSEEFEDFCPDERKKMAGYVREGTEQAIEVMNDFLSWNLLLSRGIMVYRERIEADDIKATLKSFFGTAHRKGIELAFSAGDDFSLFADKNIVSVVIRNLVSNALKFTNAGGRVAVIGKKDAVVVSDTGVGISEEKIKKLFSRYHGKSTEGTKGERGTGLGLMLVKGFLDHVGGAISVESKEGKGTDFRVSFPG